MRSSGSAVGWPPLYALALPLGQSVDHSPICSTLFDAFVDKEEVMITMADRKVYVGYIMDVGAPTEVTGVNQEILLIPTVMAIGIKTPLKLCTRPIIRVIHRSGLLVFGRKISSRSASSARRCAKRSNALILSGRVKRQRKRKLPRISSSRRSLSLWRWCRPRSAEPEVSNPSQCP